MAQTVFDSPTAVGAKILTVTATVTNTSGAYTNTIIDERITTAMKAIEIELGDPTVFGANITVTCNNGSITISCPDVEGTSTVSIDVIKTVDDPTSVTSIEFDVLNSRINKVKEIINDVAEYSDESTYSAGDRVWYSGRLYKANQAISTAEEWTAAHWDQEDVVEKIDELDDSVNALQDAIAIVAVGNTHGAVTSGQFVYVKNHDTLAEGLYKASSDIAANATLSLSNLTADNSGGLNDLKSQINTVSGNIPAVIDNLTSDSGTSALSAAQGKVLSSKMPYYGSLRTISNCLLIGNDMSSSNHNTGIVTSSSQYAPSDLVTGIREVFYISSTCVNIVIHGVDSSGVYAEWYRYYNGTVWTDWFKNATTDKILTYSAASGGGLSLSNGAFSLANSGATAGNYGPSANATPGYGATFNVPYITIDAKGRVTAASTKTVTIPASDNTNTWRGIQNNLTSTSTTDSLAAAQGKALNDRLVNGARIINKQVNAGATETFSGMANCSWVISYYHSSSYSYAAFIPSGFTGDWQVDLYGTFTVTISKSGSDMKLKNNNSTKIISVLALHSGL